MDRGPHDVCGGGVGGEVLVEEQWYLHISRLVIVGILFLSIVVKMRDKEEGGIHNELILCISVGMVSKVVLKNWWW